ncbi:hypothetical protein IW261DRAFT_1289140, partial [Armillaria novae-zelandiae]
SLLIQEDKSNYWYPVHVLLFSIYENSSPETRADYIFSDNSSLTTPFPDDFRMMSGDPNLRTLYASIFEQQAITFPYLDFNGVSTKYNKLPINLAWLSGIQ